ncbi:MAG: hypothetical protein MK076_05430 [Flavobacteriales bacterium]|nr:hypothetical protein [Flavobacteriales bacterium]
MKVLKGASKSEFLLEQGNSYIYKSLTSYDSKYEILQYSVTVNSNELGRYDSLEDALKVYHEAI